MYVRLKGINSVKKKLADGSVKTFYYAWKGGPPLRGEYGSPEFHASYNEAVARRIAPPDGLLAWVLNAYEKSEEFLGRKPSTQRGYKALIKRIDKDFGDLPLKLLSDRRTRWRIPRLARPHRANLRPTSSRLCVERARAHPGLGAQPRQDRC